MNETNEKTEKMYITASEVEPREISWLFYPYIPYGKVTILQGNPGDGKSTLMLSFSATLTTGLPLPFMIGPRQPLTVIYQTTEDDAEDTVVPRFIKAGGNSDRLIFIKEDAKALTFSDERLRRVLEETGARLLVLDPLSSYIGPVSINAANEVRPAFNHLISLARDFSCAVVLVDHLNKNQLADALYRNNGSIDKVGAARSVLTLIKDREDKAKRYLVQTKSNLAPMGHGFSFSVGTDGIEFLEEIEADPDELFQLMTASELGRPDDRLREAIEFIRGMLSNGILPARECEARLKAAGMGFSTAKKAKKVLGVDSVKRGNEWYWFLEKQGRSQ